MLIVRSSPDMEEGEEGDDVGYIVGGIAGGVIVSTLVAFGIVSLGKSMGEVSAVAASKSI